MLDAITSQLPPATRDQVDRSISAASGALFGVVLASALALVSGRAPFALDPATLTLYASVIPLSIAGFMVQFSRNAPRLPMLATLWFLALFIPGMFMSELFSLGQELHIGGLQLPSHDFVGFRAIVVAVISGVAFTGIRADGSLGEELETVSTATASKVDWQSRHEEAIRRLAMVDVDLRQQRSAEQRALAAFDAMLANDREAADEWALDLEAEEQDVVAEAETQAAA